MERAVILTGEIFCVVRDGESSDIDRWDILCCQGWWEHWAVILTGDIFCLSEMMGQGYLQVGEAVSGMVRKGIFSGGRNCFKDGKSSDILVCLGWWQKWYYWQVRHCVVRDGKRSDTDSWDFVLSGMVREVILTVEILCCQGWWQKWYWQVSSVVKDGE